MRAQRSVSFSGANSVAAATIVALFLAPVLPAQSFAPPAPPKPRWKPDKSLALSAAQTPGLPGLLDFKLRDDLGAQVLAGALVAGPGGGDVSAVAQILASFSGTRVERLVPEDDAFLQQLRHDGELESGEELADLTQLFRAEFAHASWAEAALPQLLALDVVETAYSAPRLLPPPGDFGVATPSFTAQQGYRSAAPAGIDAAYAHGLPAGKAPGVAIFDLELVWNLGHEDLQRWGPKAFTGSAYHASAGQHGHDHGTAVLGILGADEDGSGVTGLAPEARLRVITTYPATGYNVAAALGRAGRVARRGDVVLLEDQASGPNQPPHANNQFGALPIEYVDAVYFAIRALTANGIHVVEAGGNGSQNLDFGMAVGGVGVATGHPSYLEKFDLRVRDSGAVIVAAATSGAPHVMLGFSNFGSRIDAYSWGDNVVTTGYGDIGGFAPPAADVNQRYTSTFGGTSSASPIVTAALAILQAQHRAKHGKPYHPFAARQLLRSVGTPPMAQFLGPAIGLQPDLKAQIPLLATGPNVGTVRSGAMAGDRFGAAVAGIGDVNGDGRDDWAVGAPRATGNQANSGVVYVLDGTTGKILRELKGDHGNSGFGWSVAGIGDVDADGVPDLCVGAPFYDTGPPLDRGRISVFRGSTFGQIAVIDSDQANELMGWSVAAAGDHDQDGIPDLLAGHPFRDTGAVDSGRVTVFGHVGPQEFQWQAKAVFDGDADDGYLGYSVALVPDANEDGRSDFLLGAPASVGLEQKGRAFLRAAGTGELLRTYTGTVAGEWLGAAVRPAGDLDGDGRGDHLVASPRTGPGGDGQGVARVHSAADGAVIHAVASPHASIGFAEAVSGAGDLDGDGRDDFLVGAPRCADLGAGTGCVFAYSGATGQLLQRFVGPSASSLLGSAIEGLADLNGDGRPEVLAGAPGSAATDPGRALAFLVGGKGDQPVAPEGLAVFGFGTPGCTGDEVPWANQPSKLGAADFLLTCTNAPYRLPGTLLVSTVADPLGNSPLGIFPLLHLDIGAPGFLSFVVNPSNASYAGFAWRAFVLPTSPALAGRKYFAQFLWPWTPATQPFTCDVGNPIAQSSSRGLEITLLPP